MKYRILVASCVTILALACSRPDVEIPVGVQTQDMQDVTFDVDYENGATKSFYVGSTHAVRFQTGDSLAVWNGSPFRVISMGKQASLRGAINAPDTPRLMAFPLSDVLEFPNNDSVKIVLPAVQEAFSGGFAPKTNVSVGWMDPQSTSVSFRNCLSYIRFDRRGDGPLWNAIEVEALGGEALSGEFLVGRDAVLRPGANTSSRVRLEGEINFINYMLLGIPSGEYKKGLKLHSCMTATSSSLVLSVRRSSQGRRFAPSAEFSIPNTRVSTKVPTRRLKCLKRIPRRDLIS